MKTKHTYRTTDVERVDMMALLSVLTVGCLVSIDVAKTKFVAALVTAAGEVVKLLRFEHPRQTWAFLKVLEALRDAKLEPHVLMEPTGTYGDAVRHQVDRLGISVHMMQPKHTHDIAEVIDGVPSMHDGKATIALAQLYKLTSPPKWEPESEARRNVRAMLETRAPMMKTAALYHGHLESLLARHWPEFHLDIDVRTQRSWMPLLRQLPGPDAVSASEHDARAILWKASRGGIKPDRIERIIDSAKATTGVPIMAEERRRMRHVVEEIQHVTHQIDEVDARIVEAIEHDTEAKQMAVVVGPACAAAIVSVVGSPAMFANATALEKAIGLNLKERSSGEKKGRLGISKRGSSQVRQLLYMAALRLIMVDPIVAAWYRARRSYKNGSKICAVVAVMRKLVRALWHVARGNAFDASRLFDVSRLTLESPNQSADTRTSFEADDARPRPTRPTFKSKGGAPQPTA